MNKNNLKTIQLNHAIKTIRKNVNQENRSTSKRLNEMHCPGKTKRNCVLYKRKTATYQPQFKDRICVSLR